MGRAGQLDIPSGDVSARMLLAALTEAGLAVAASPTVDERRHVGALVLRFLGGLR